MLRYGFGLLRFLRRQSFSCGFGNGLLRFHRDGFLGFRLGSCRIQSSRVVPEGGFQGLRIVHRKNGDTCKPGGSQTGKLLRGIRSSQQINTFQTTAALHRGCPQFRQGTEKSNGFQLAAMGKGSLFHSPDTFRQGDGIHRRLRKSTLANLRYRDSVDGVRNLQVYRSFFRFSRISANRCGSVRQYLIPEIPGFQNFGVCRKRRYGAICNQHHYCKEHCQQSFHKPASCTSWITK